MSKRGEDTLSKVLKKTEKRIVNDAPKDVKTLIGIQLRNPLPILLPYSKLSKTRRQIREKHNIYHKMRGSVTN